MEWVILKTFAYIIAACIVVVNLLFCIVGVKTFSRKMHSVLVLCLGIGDGFHGIAVLGLTGAFLDPVIQEGQRKDINVPFCITKFVLYFISLAFSLTILLFISVERYVTVKNFNFLKAAFSLRKKYIAISIFITTVWIYICIWILTAPVRHAHIERCSVGALYDEHTLDINGWAIICLFVVLILGNLILYGKTTRVLWKLFSKSTLLSQKRNTFHTNRGFTFPRINETPKDPMHEPSMLTPRKKNFWSIPRTQLLQNKVKIHPENPGPSKVTIKENDDQKAGPSGQRACKKRKISVLLNPWERRAMITNCYLIADHVILFLPFIGLLIADRCRADIPHGAWVFAIFWLMLHFLVNPFIFAWRIKEIHAEIKKILHCYSQVEPQARFSLSKRASRKYSTMDFNQVTKKF